MEVNIKDSKYSYQAEVISKGLLVIKLHISCTISEIFSFISLSKCKLPLPILYLKASPCQNLQTNKQR